MTIAKDFRFPVSVRWLRHGLTVAVAPDGKPPLQVAVAEQFRGRDPDVWSPEELLVAAVTSCYAVTLEAVAGRLNLVLGALTVDGVGHVESGRDGRLRFVRIDVHATIEADEASLPVLEEAARAAEGTCIVHGALETPVRFEVETRASEPGRGTA